MNKNYQFVGTDPEKLERLILSAYEKITERTVNPSDPERLFIAWVCSIIVQERAITNYVGNQNIPSRAEGQNLDALGELFYKVSRSEATSAHCTIRFTISALQETSILIPSDTRITDSSGKSVWHTVKDVYIPIGQKSVEVSAECEAKGTEGNGFVPGQICRLVDVDNVMYYLSCENIDESSGGAAQASDEEYYELMRASMDAYSCAGAKGGYEYFAKNVSTEISDVVANSPTPGKVNIYVLMDGGKLAPEEIKIAVLDACNADYVRPLTDLVTVEDAQKVQYDISLKYYIPERSSQSYSDIEVAVKDAVERYIDWQRKKLGRDINPSKLYEYLMQAGIKRVELISPTFVPLKDGRDNSTPQIAELRSISVVNGGVEDE